MSMAALPLPLPLPLRWSRCGAAAVEFFGKSSSIFVEKNYYASHYNSTMIQIKRTFLLYQHNL
jgi:hypothetical protein